MSLPLRTSRLLVRRFRPEDASALAAYRTLPEVARYQGWSAPVTEDEARRLVREFTAADPDAPGWFQYAVEERESGVLVGDVGVRLDANGMQADLGFTLAPAAQGRGYATEAVRAVLGDLFERRGLRRVSAVCDARNHASARLLERVGFRREGMRPAYTWLKGEWTDDVLYGLLAEWWRD
ncbi:GNAT family N-acetyltransferase [Streptomyces sp. SID11385]|uniref:GNAT family N-acetyltransferase n=1 Tax=Streptomyces sp. SID11385 TaxID=2706031 RepID=UPI0013CD80B3|nr:GNAT family N-acetyltransferase [Streptomyces sp. SID11385]NEA40210.1 GNAT family N-acetyltransferase [Streptomyces sp. SID11385]